MKKTISIIKGLTLVSLFVLSACSPLLIDYTESQGVDIIKATRQPTLTPEKLDPLTEINIYPKQIAVLLPFEGKYQHVAKQIRTGIIKAFFASDQKTALMFYNSSNTGDIEAIYRQAKLEGADFIIGPLRKEAIEELAHIEDNHLLALNKSDEADFSQFSFKSADEISQIVKLFNQLNYQHIGILSNDSRKDSLQAIQLRAAWEADTKHTAVLRTYPNKSDNLRKLLGGLINETNSKSRYQDIHWTINKKLSFLPRIRQDFDAIIIFDGNSRLAVFQPQFVFFELDVPVYASTKITPENLQDKTANKDLSNVHFLTFLATLEPSNLASKFEAFGWDSFQIARQLRILRLGGVLTDTKMGESRLENNQIVQKLVWAKYNKKGRIEPLFDTISVLKVETEADIKNVMPLTETETHHIVPLLVNGKVKFKIEKNVAEQPLPLTIEPPATATVR